MSRTTRMAVLAGAVGAAVALPGVAQAKTKTVFMGLPSRSVGKQFQKQLTEVNDYFPHGITVHVGDRVKFVPTEFHNVDLPARGGQITPLISPAGSKVSGVNDEAGAPFWFNGQDQLGFTRSLAQGSFGKKVTYNGTHSLNSGLPLAPKVKPMVVKFTKTGSYTYYCNIHPGMKGTVHVVAARRSVPSAKADRKALKNQITRDLKIAKTLARTRTPAATVDLGAGGPHGVERLAMVPGTVNAKVGQTVTFRMTKGSFEDHTATFGPGNIEDQSSYLGTLAASFNAPMFDPRAVYSSEKPGDSPASYSALLHGNGFWNSGVLDRSNATPLPPYNSVRFDTPGTYTYYCLIHPFMVGKIVVK